MKGFCKLFPIALFLLVSLGIASASAGDIYISQSGSGGANGSACSNAYPVSFFNSSAGWGSADTQIGPGTTVHLCGTFTGAGGSTMLTAQGSGASGNPVTILFEDGAVLTAPYWSAAGALNTNSKTYLVIDGGNNGTVKATANGTNLANHQTSRGINASYCTGCTVKDVTVANIYVHASASDTNVDQTNTNCISYLSANNFTVDNVVCHDAGWGLNGWGNNLKVSNSEVYNVDHGLAVGPSSNISGINIVGNHIHDFAAWDTSSNTYHHDGIHMWGESGVCITGGNIYNNQFDGDTGVNITGFIFLEECNQNVNIFNNVFITQSSRTNQSIWFEGRTTGHGVNNAAYNNFIQGGASSSGDGIFSRIQDQLTVVNNVVMGAQSTISLVTTTVKSVDHNLYQDLAASGASTNTFGWNGSNVSSIDAWRSACHCDTNSQALPASSMKFDSTGHPLAGSPAMDLGANLASVGIAALKTDKQGAARAASGVWVAGAYTGDTASSPSRPAPPEGLQAVVH